MEKGMLWFDDRKDISIEQKINAAVLFYQQKYGGKPDRCTVNPTVTAGAISKNLAGLRIEVSQYILPNHFLLEEDR